MGSQKFGAGERNRMSSSTGNPSFDNVVDVADNDDDEEEGATTVDDFVPDDELVVVAAVAAAAAASSARTQSDLSLHQGTIATTCSCITSCVTPEPKVCNVMMTARHSVSFRSMPTL